METIPNAILNFISLYCLQTVVQQTSIVQKFGNTRMTPSTLGGHEGKYTPSSSVPDLAQRYVYTHARTVTLTHSLWTMNIVWCLVCKIRVTVKWVTRTIQQWCYRYNKYTATHKTHCLTVTVVRSDWLPALCPCSSGPTQAVYFPALSLQPWRWRQRVFSKRRHRPANTHGTKTQDLYNNMTIISVSLKSHLYNFRLNLCPKEEKVIQIYLVILKALIICNSKEKSVLYW
jgi:hypothetical protein